MIDPDKFLNQKVSGGGFDTNYVPVPKDEYICMIPTGGVQEPREVQTKNGTSVIVDINWELTSEDPKFKKVCEHTGMDRPFVRQSIFVDVDYDNDGNVIGLSRGIGKNVQLGRLQQAVGQANKENWTWRHLEGQVARIKVDHRVHEGDIFASVPKKNGVTKI